MPEPMQPTGPRTGLPLWVWAVFLVLLALCVPWYVPAGGMIKPIYWAFPLWGWLMVGAYVLLGVFGCFVYLKLWPQDPDADDASSGDEDAAP